jgi:hypothetical protein
VVPNYTGTVTLSTGNSADTLPPPTAFAASDKGKHVFSVTFAAGGTETLTATDNATPPLTGKVTVNIAAAGVVTHFGIQAIPFALSNTAFNIYVVALDANNKVVPTYTGMVQFTSSDSGATLPAEYQFVAGDNGKHEFSVTLATAGKQTVTVTDATTSTITATLSVYVISGIVVNPPVPVMPPTPITPPNPIMPGAGGISLPDLGSALAGLSQLFQGFGSFGDSTNHQH